ncbi:Ubx5 protein [Saccharomycopsis crataegensis]|uniref:Ubx5 protein n=1 Tax=Saccharomycopsis crataegensis TaxID=43959 RepID=A0AAV5QIY8_9ASCO|nr:Ubx5 protein [Saccharomycopsis crataegensis]
MNSSQVSNFVAITNSDTETAVKYLEFSGGDLESAITFFFESGGTAIGASGSNNNNNGQSVENDEELASRLQSEQYQQGDDIRPPDEMVRERLVEDDFGMGGTGFPTHHHRRAPLPFSERGIFNQYETDMLEEDDQDDDNGANLYDQQFESENSTLTEHQKRLAKLFRPPFDLIEKLTLDGARQKGRLEKKWILLNIQDASNFSCQLLNRDFWSDAQVKDVVTTSFIFLQYQYTDYPVQEYIQFNNVEEYPYIAILDPFSGERYKMWSEVPNKQKWLEEVHDFSDRYSLHPGHKNPAITHKKKVDPNSLTEEQQLQLAMRKSMNSNSDEDVNDVHEVNNYFNPISLDSDDEGSEPEFEEDEEDEEEQEQEEEYTSGPSINGESKTRVEPSNQENEDEHGVEEVEEEGLTPEEVFATILAIDHPEPPTGSPGTTRIQFRFGDGSRVVRSFKVTDKVRVIYEVLKFNYDQVKDKVFTISSQRVNLIDKLNETIESAGLLRSSMLVETDDE